MDKKEEFVVDDDVVVVKGDDKDDKNFDYEPYISMVLGADYDL